MSNNNGEKGDLLLELFSEEIPARMQIGSEKQLTSLFEKSLMDRDIIHRQTAATTVKHIALGVCGLDCEDALLHLMNFVWPNVLEISPHVINAVMEAVEGLIAALGPGRIFMYISQGLYHPARKIRDTYWKIYNSLYIFGQDALTPIYPKLEDDTINVYRRNCLELFI